jgi:uncharacterized protein YnzC (UPF0291/DUF896 family)
MKNGAETKPVPSSTVERLLAKAEDRQKQEELTQEELKDFQRAVNSILSSKNGKLFWKMSRKIMKVDKVSNDFTPINMAVEKAYLNYHNFVMKFLDPEIRAELIRELY